MNDVQKNLLSAYQDILANLSCAVSHNEDINRSLSKAPGIATSLIAYEGFGHFSPLVSSTNVKQIAKRIPRETLHDLVFVSMLSSVVSFQILTLNKQRYWHNIAELCTRHEIFQSALCAKSSVLSSFIHVLSYTLASFEQQDDYRDAMIGLIDDSGLKGSLDLMELLQQPASSSVLRLLDMGLKLYTDDKLIGREVEMGKNKTFCLRKMLLRPNYITKSTPLLAFYRLNHFVDYVEFVPVIHGSIYAYE